MAGIDRLAAGARIWGTVCAGDGQQVQVAGLGPFARVGDWLMLEGRPGREPCAEIVRLERDGATAMLLRPGDGVGVGGRAWLTRCAVAATLCRVARAHCRLSRLQPRGRGADGRT